MKNKKIILVLLLLVILFFIYYQFKYWSVRNFQEGEKFDMFGGFDEFKDTCAKGLTPVPASHVINGDSCAIPTCPCYICTKCGDGICGKGENGCNCEKDCKKGEGE
jgi:hypothetical protein